MSPKFPAPTAIHLILLALCLSLVPATWGAGRFKVLHNFGASGDGTTPNGPLILDGEGNLYGVTCCGPGDYGNGVLFELTPQNNGTWKEKILHSFTGGSGGARPWGSLLFNGSGNLYGTMRGCLGDAVCGAFQLVPAAGSWKFSVIYDVSAGPGLLMGKAGNLYGAIGPGNYFDIGAIGELSPGSNGWTYTDLFNFNPTVGYAPPAPPIWDGKGNMLGTTTKGGAQPACWTSDGCGMIFEMTPNKDGTWTYHILHRFASSKTDGQTPWAGLVRDSVGNFYGSTVAGGRYGLGNGGYGNGTVFRLSFTGGRWRKTALYEFPNCAEGCGPLGAMALDRSGNLYGAAQGGLPDCAGFDCGVIFKLSPQAGGKWTYTVLHKLTAADGEYPTGVVLDGKGHLLGTTQSFGKYDFGTAFEIVP